MVTTLRDHGATLTLQEYAMKNQGGRPLKANKFSEYLEIRVEAAEKQAFKDAARDALTTRPGVAQTTV